MNIKKVRCQWCRKNLKSNKAHKIGKLMVFCDDCYSIALKNENKGAKRRSVRMV